MSEHSDADRLHQGPTVDFVAVLRSSVSLAAGAVFCCGWQNLSYAENLSHPLPLSGLQGAKLIPDFNSVEFQNAQFL